MVATGWTGVDVCAPILSESIHETDAIRPDELRGASQHEAHRFPTLIPKWRSVELPVLPTILDSTHSTPNKEREILSTRLRLLSTPPYRPGDAPDRRVKKLWEPPAWIWFRKEKFDAFEYILPCRDIFHRVGSFGHMRAYNRL